MIYIYPTSRPDIRQRNHQNECLILSRLDKFTILNHIFNILNEDSALGARYDLQKIANTKNVTRNIIEAIFSFV
jgi:hypothetical protein